ncbi:MAG: hypothetical protein EOT04_02840 [Candidatus Chaera renei]|uniref:Uncharacterized protein n=1 Tax=Candidatus Chaera renei TaxID=2506947 RepID=A0A4Q0AGD3_9BACT|nr:MAG: hypothetical protein EOT04_02840 [Candidatus Chaera renei]
MQTPGSSFLHERNPNLHTSQEVENVVGYLRNGGEAIPNEPADKISSYLGFLASREYVNDGILTGDQSSIDRQIEAHVIKAEDVPEGYFELQRRIAREQGHGDIEITSEMRRLMTEAVQADQRAGLGKWVEYLGGEDGGYPDWFKHYTWTSITKLGTYDKDKQEFQKRSRGTTAPYPELNREALAYVYDVLNKARVQGEKVDGGANDEKLQKLLKSANFGKLYAHAVLEVTPDSPELRKDTRGSWTKFNQTDDPRTARRLAGSLQGHGTGWCTAGESTASIQLQGGDFYVYYTRDEDGKDTVPRVAIRMQDGKVAEVRGVNAAQELEPEMADITAEQLKKLPGGEEYIRKAEYMKRLTAIEKKIAANPNAELTSEELRFLYELDHEIEGFGYEEDPRIGEIRTLRGDRDKPELARILPEAIMEQVRSAYTAYRTVADKLLGTKRGVFGKREAAISAQDVKQLFATKDREWQANGTYDYLVEQLIENGARFNLVATPNIEASEDQIVALAEDFGKDQPYSTYVYDELYRRGRYSGREWSGNSGNAPVRLSLIPSRVDNELSYKRADEQVRLLRERQARRPELHARVPSLLDAVTYWYSLRAQGDKLDDSSAFDKTYIRHFDLEPKTVDRWSLVPDSYVAYDGWPRLNRSRADREYVARLAVG